MKLFEYHENSYNIETKQRVKVAEWSVVPSGLHNNSIIIQKITPNYQRGDVIKKVIKVEECDEFVFKALKTKIKAIGGAEGLVDWMIKDVGTFECRIRQLLNYAWDEMKYNYL